MAWVKLDHKFHWHKRIRPLSDAAYRLYVGGLCFCNWQETDGEIVQVDLEVVCQGMKPRAIRPAIGELITAGLWREVTNGYEVENYLKFQPAKADLEARREHLSSIGRKGGLSKRDEEAPRLSVPLNPASSVRHDRHVTTVTADTGLLSDAAVRILDWWCNRKGWVDVPTSKKTKEYGVATTLAGLDIPEDELMSLLEDGWNAAESKPFTLEYFWRKVQDHAHGLQKVRKPVVWSA
jgi:hypothetical protein